MSGESLNLDEGSTVTVKRTWKEGSDEDTFKALLFERDSILDIPHGERPILLMNRYRDIAEKIRRWKGLFPHINIKRPSKAAEKRKAADKARLSSDENRAADRARKSTEEYKAADRARKSTDEYKAADRERKSTEEYKARDRARKSTEEYKAADRARKSTKEYKAAARERKATKKIAEQNMMRPQAPEVHHAWAGEGYAGTNNCPSMRPTCILGEPLWLGLSVTSYPAPTFTWKKDNKEIGKTISGGTPLQRNPQLKEEANQQDDAVLILTEDGSAGTESTSKSAEVVSGRMDQDDFKQRPVINKAKKQSISNSWQRRRMRCFASWNPISRAQPDIGSADSTLYIEGQLLT